MGDDSDLASLLLSLATHLPAPLLLAVMQHMPCVVVARLACVHKSFLSARQQLRALSPPGRWEAPSKAKRAEFAGARPLVRAAWLGDCGVITQLVAAGANVHDANEHALRTAACYGHDAVVSQLISAGADVHCDLPLKTDTRPLLLNC